MHGSITLKDIFTGIDSTKIHGDCDISRTFRTKDNRELCIRITGLFLDLMMKDVVKGNNIYSFNKTKSLFFNIKKLNKEELIHARKHNANLLKNQDPFKTNFNGYVPNLKATSKGFTHDKVIFFGKKYIDILSESANSGCKFNNYDIKTYEDYIDEIKKDYDKIHTESIKYILHFINTKIYFLLKGNYELHLTYRPLGVSLFMKFNKKKLDHNTLESRHQRRVKYLSRFGKYKFDGYYYFSLSKNSEEKFNTEKYNVKLFRYFECTMAYKYEGIIYRVKLNDNENNFSYIKEYEKSDVEYVSRRSELRSRQGISTKQYSNRLFERNTDNI